MSMSFARRWRAGRFADLIDQATGRGRLPRHGPRHQAPSRSDRELSELVALAQRAGAALWETAEEPDPEFRANLRTTLLGVAEREGIGAARQSPVQNPVKATGGANTTTAPAKTESAKTESAGTESDGTGTVPARVFSAGSPKPWAVAKRILARGRVRGAFVVGAAIYVLALSSLAASSGEATASGPSHERSTVQADSPSPPRPPAGPNSTWRSAIP